MSQWGRSRPGPGLVCRASSPLGQPDRALCSGGTAQHRSPRGCSSPWGRGHIPAHRFGSSGKTQRFRRGTCHSPAGLPRKGQYVGTYEETGQGSLLQRWSGPALTQPLSTRALRIHTPPLPCFSVSEPVQTSPQTRLILVLPRVSSLVLKPEEQGCPWPVYVGVAHGS